QRDRELRYAASFSGAAAFALARVGYVGAQLHPYLLPWNSERHAIAAERILRADFVASPQGAARHLGAHARDLATQGDSRAAFRHFSAAHRLTPEDEVLVAEFAEFCQNIGEIDMARDLALSLIWRIESPELRRRAEAI